MKKLIKKNILISFFNMIMYQQNILDLKIFIMQELTALQWFNQELQKADKLTNVEYTTLLLKAFEMQEKQHKETFEAGIDQCMKHVNTGESLYEFQYYFDKKFYI